MPQAQTATPCNVVYAEIEAYLTDGGKYIIVDVRNNGGGYSSVNDDVIAALGISDPPVYGKQVYVGKSLSGNADYSQDCYDQFALSSEMSYLSTTFNVKLSDMEGQFIEFQQPHLGSTRERKSIFVLLSKNTFSAGTSFAAQLQDSGAATLIGQAPVQAPNFFAGSTVDYSLPLSTIKYCISRTLNTRADTNASKSELVIDVLCSSENALEVALRQTAK